MSFLSSYIYYIFFSTNVYKYAIHCRQIYCSEGQRDFAGKALLLNAVVVVVPMLYMPVGTFLNLVGNSNQCHKIRSKLHITMHNLARTFSPKMELTVAIFTLKLRTSYQ